MHLPHRLAAIVLTLGLSASLVGCGFHLKGNDFSTTPLIYKQLSLAFPDANNTEELESRLKIYLGATGVQLSDANDAYVLRVLEYQPRRQLLNGKLTEVILRLTVTFQIEDRQGRKITEPRSLTASRSYQYDVATVNTDNQQEAYLKRIIIDDMAQQMTRQIAANRLPKAQP